MLKKFFMALLIAAASFNFATTSEAADSNAENYCCGNYYDNDCCYGDGNYNNDYRGDYRGGRCCR